MEKSLVQSLMARQKENGGYLSVECLQGVARKFRTPLYRVQELVSFYNSFRLTPPPKVTVQVCRDFACQIGGSHQLIEALKREFHDEIEAELVLIEGKSCIGCCDAPAAVCINHHTIPNGNMAKISSLIRETLSGNARLHKASDRTIPEEWSINPYPQGTPFSLVRQFVESNDREAFADKILDTMEAAKLVGKGGPGQTTFKKWKTVRKYGKTRDYRYVVCNADESEPGTFKDRELLLRTPHLVVEGMLIAAFIIGAQKGYIYVRHEYEDQIEALRECIEKAKKNNFCGNDILGSSLSCDLEVFVSPGNYICGEQTALIEAMEDKRAQPRQRPPDLEIQGYKGWPTLVNNVETFAWVPSIVLNGSDWYRKLGANDCPGKRFVSLSGDINRPGVYEVPLGSTVGDLLNIAGGMRNGQKMIAFAPSGPSGGFLPANLPAAALPKEFASEHIPEGETTYDLLKLTLDNNYFRYQLKSRFNLGAAHLFIGEETDLVALVKSCTEFYRNESCGKCVPCRLGSQKLVQLSSSFTKEKLNKLPEYFDDLVELMRESSICGLGQVAANPLISLRQYFPELVEQR